MIKIEMMETDTETLSDNLLSWSIRSISNTDIEIQLKFAKPIDVSQGSEKDMLLVYLNFGGFRDKQGLSMPEFEFLQKKLPTQFESEDELAAMQAAGEVQSGSAASFMSTNFMLNIGLSQSLNSLWSMLNTAQIVVLMPLFADLKMPTNAAEMNKSMVKVAMLDVIDTGELIDPRVYSLTDQHDHGFNESFEDCGFDSTLVISNFSINVWAYGIHILFLAIFVLPVYLISTRTSYCSKLYGYLKSYFFWAGLLRIFMQTFLELFLTSMLNLMTADYDTENASEKFSNILAWPLFICSIGIAILLAVYIWRNFATIDANSSVSMILEGTKYK